MSAPFCDGPLGVERGREASREGGLLSVPVDGQAVVAAVLACWVDDASIYYVLAAVIGFFTFVC